MTYRKILTFSPENGQQLGGTAGKPSKQPLPELLSLGLRAPPSLVLKERDRSSPGQSPGTWPHLEQRPTEGSWSARLPGGEGGRLLPFLSAPPSSLRPPPPPSSLRGRVGGHANFAERPQVAGYSCGVRRGVKQRGAGLPEPWLRIRGPPPTASGIGVVGRADRSPARTPPAWRRFPRREGTGPAAPPSAHSPGTQSGRS